MNSIRNHFNTEFSIYRISSSIDVNNFEYETEVLYTKDKGYIEPLSGNERYISDKWQALTTYRLFCPVIDITESDEIEIGSEKYNIDLIQNMRNNHLEIYLIGKK